jgi:hypothetical protein
LILNYSLGIINGNWVINANSLYALAARAAQGKKLGSKTGSSKISFHETFFSQ